MSISRNTLAQSTRGISLFQGCKFCGCFQELWKCQHLYALHSNLSVTSTLFVLVGESLGHFLPPYSMEVSVPTYLQHQPSSHGHEIPNHGKAHPRLPNQADLSECFQ